MKKKAMEISSRVLLTWPKKDHRTFPATLLWGTGVLLHSPPVWAEARGLSLLAGFLLSASESSWGILGGLVLFLQSAQ